MNLDFKRLTNDRQFFEDEPLTFAPLNPEENPYLKEGVFFVGLKNGFHASFFVSGQVDNKSIQKIRTNSALYLRAPPWAKYYCLYGTKRKKSGWDYQISWWPVNPEEGEANDLD